MNKTNKRKILKIFEQYKVEEDLYDYEAMWDSKINDEENIRKIGEDIELLSNSNDFEEKAKSDLKIKKVSIKYKNRA